MRRTEADKQLDGFLAKFTPEVAALGRRVLERVRGLVPGAVEMVYDNVYALVIGFSPTERASEAVLSVALYPRWVNLFFLDGVALPDPAGLLRGSGKVVRHVRIVDAAQLDDPALVELIAAAVREAEPAIDAGAARRIVIKQVAERQRPRRPVVNRGAREGRGGAAGVV